MKVNKTSSASVISAVMSCTVMLAGELASLINQTYLSRSLLTISQFQVDLQLCGSAPSQSYIVSNWERHLSLDSGPVLAVSVLAPYVRFLIVASCLMHLDRAPIKSDN